MNKPFLSFIVPIYNVELYLRECLDSLISQTEKNFEVILVNDGSTDSSKEIAQEYVNSDNRFLLISQDNEGLSAARNKGIENAKGRYIAFVDSDDYIVPDYVCKVMNAFNIDNSEMVLFNAYRLRDNELYHWREQKVLENKEIVNLLSETLKGKYINIAAWNKCYKKELFDKLRFKPNIKFEDYYMTPDLFFLCENISVLNDVLYIYRDNDQSIMRKAALKGSDDIFVVTDYVLDRCEILFGREFYMNNLWWCLRRVWKWVVRIYYQESHKDNKQFLNKIKRYLEPYLNIVFTNKSNMTLSEKIGVFTFCKINVVFRILIRIRRILWLYEEKA